MTLEVKRGMEEIYPIARFGILRHVPVGDDLVGYLFRKGELSGSVNGKEMCQHDIVCFGLRVHEDFDVN